MKNPPLVLRLPRALLKNFNLAALIAADPRWSWSDGRLILGQFELTRPERRFALRVLRERTNYWLFRCSQAHACADFALIDMSVIDPQQRRLILLELKAHQRLAVAGPMHPQFKKGAQAMAAIACEVTAFDRHLEPLRLIGDEESLITWLGCARRWRDPIGTVTHARAQGRRS